MDRADPLCVLLASICSRQNRQISRKIVAYVCTLDKQTASLSVLLTLDRLYVLRTASKPMQNYNKTGQH